MSENSANWKPKVLLISTFAGALTGLFAGYLLSRAAEERGDNPPKIKTSDGLKLLVATVGLVRSVAALGDGK